MSRPRTEQQRLNREKAKRDAIYQQDPKATIHDCHGKHVAIEVSTQRDWLQYSRALQHQQLEANRAHMEATRECYERMQFVQKVLAEFDGHPEAKTFADLKAEQEFLSKLEDELS